MARFKPKYLTPAQVEEALRIGARLNRDDLVMWHDGKGGYYTTIAAYVRKRQRAQQIRQARKKVER